MQDNTITRAIYDSFVNATFRKHDVYIDGKQYKYTGFTFTDKGLIHINLSSTSKGDVNYGICWSLNSAYSDWNGEIHNGFYGDKIEITIDNKDGSGGNSGWDSW